MKVLIIHNRYRLEGGEEAVVAAERSLLEKNGHEVLSFELNNRDVDNYNIFKKLLLPLKVIWSQRTYKDIGRIIRKENPDIAHIHNTFFLISPSAYYACRDQKLPVVQSLHNYRFLCPLGILYRDGNICKACWDKGLFMSLKYRCGKKSKSWMGAMLWTLAFHYKNKTFRDLIDTYIALSNFSKKQFVEAGFNAEKIKIKPNFTSLDPGPGTKRDNFVLYAGRLSPEKGIDVLLETWKKINDIPLKIIGDGIETKRIRNYIREYHLNAEFLGRKPNNEAVDLIKRSLCIVLPSRCHENFPCTLAEAFACGTPVVAARNGAIAEIVEDGKTGLLFEPENTDDLAQKIRLLYENKNIREEMSRAARQLYEEKYTPQKNYEQLIGIYGETVENYRRYKPLN